MNRVATGAAGRGVRKHLPVNIGSQRLRLNALVQLDGPWSLPAGRLALTASVWDGPALVGQDGLEIAL